MNLVLKTRTDLIKKEALASGFLLCGITTKFLPEHAAYFAGWLKDKKYAGMKFFEKYHDLRLDPQKIMQNARSAIVLASSYSKQNPGGLGSYIARYAHGDDYHHLMKKKMAGLVVRLKTITQTDFATILCVDTAPVNERDLAGKAGLGWIGKNTLLVNREYGSTFFLGVIFTDLELIADEIESDHCGACSLCIDSCPTAALVPYQLNVEKCLSYQTIELRGERDKALWASLAGHLVGCDVCQDVCPYNSRDNSTRDGKAGDDTPWPSIRELLSMSKGEYERRFKTSAIARIRYPDFMRNLFLVMAKHPDRSVYREDLLGWKNAHPKLVLAEFDYLWNKLCS